VLDSALRPVEGVELPKKVFTSMARWMSLIVELNASINMFYLLKHLLLLNLVIFKLMCNNLTFNKILSLYASYVCLLYSRFIENHPIWILEDGPSFLRWSITWSKGFKRERPNEVYSWCLPWSRLEEGLALVKLGVSSWSTTLEPTRHDAWTLLKDANSKQGKNQHGSYALRLIKHQ
jgi:hypothetical protein